MAMKDGANDVECRGRPTRSGNAGAEPLVGLERPRAVRPRAPGSTPRTRSSRQRGVLQPWQPALDDATGVGKMRKNQRNSTTKPNVHGDPATSAVTRARPRGSDAVRGRRSPAKAMNSRLPMNARAVLVLEQTEQQRGDEREPAAGSSTARLSASKVAGGPGLGGTSTLEPRIAGRRPPDDQPHRRRRSWARRRTSSSRPDPGDGTPHPVAAYAASMTSPSRRPAASEAPQAGPALATTRRPARRARRGARKSSPDPRVISSCTCCTWSDTRSVGAARARRRYGGTPGQL